VFRFPDCDCVIRYGGLVHHQRGVDRDDLVTYGSPCPAMP
jgi:hypothetical protein